MSLDDRPLGQRLVLNAIIKERDRQDAKWGAQRHIDPFKWNTILGEEYGEVCEATLDLNHAPKSPLAYENLRAELVQVAAVAVAMLEDFDEQMRLNEIVSFAGSAK